MKPVEGDGETEPRGLVVVGASVHRVCLSRRSSGPSWPLDQPSFTGHDTAKKSSNFTSMHWTRFFTFRNFIDAMHL